MSNTQLAVQLLSWAFLFYLHSRTLKRGELARVKDTLIKTINELPEWTAAKVESSISDLKLEDIFAGKVSSIELMVKQLNDYKHRDIIDLDLITKIRSIDVISYRSRGSSPNAVLDPLKKSELMFELDSLAFELVTHIENEYFSNFSSSFNLQRFVANYRDSILGATCGSIIVFAFMYIFNTLYL